MIKQNNGSNEKQNGIDKFNETRNTRQKSIPPMHEEIIKAIVALSMMEIRDRQIQTERQYQNTNGVD